jgi:cobalt-zinc-cadmium efflux system membrane fusion protein
MMRILPILTLSLVLAACGGKTDGASNAEDGHAAPAAEFERGPHRGRMLRDGEFAIEVTIFETNVPPEYRLYAYRNDKPLPPAEVQATVELKRLDGEVNRFAFKPEGDYLRGDGVVTEPHSFDVKVTARHGATAHEWIYDSYEGRATIPDAIAKDAGVRTERAGGAVIRGTVQLMGSVALDQNRHAQIKARFPGIVRAVQVREGQQVRRGQTLVVVEGNESMRTYPVTAPFDGVVLARNTNVGDVANDNTLIELANMGEVWIELHAIGLDAGKLSVGQDVRIRSATGDAEETAKIETLLPLATRGQSVVARASISNPSGQWRPGMTVSAEVTIDAREVPLAVRESGLQRFRDFTVVFAKVGDTYEVRMLELGQRDGEWAEVLGGLKPGTPYVTEQSYLIRADIEKSGASHDH